MGGLKVWAGGFRTMLVCPAFIESPCDLLPEHTALFYKGDLGQLGGSEVGGDRGSLLREFWLSLLFVTSMSSLYGSQTAAVIPSQPGYPAKNSCISIVNWILECFGLAAPAYVIDECQVVQVIAVLYPSRPLGWDENG